MNNANANVLVLTTGLSGSSLVTGLIAQAGFWTGDSTEYKNNSTGKYETYENSRFVELNDLLVRLSGQHFGDLSWYDNQLRSKFRGLYSSIDLTEFHEFASYCRSHEPWILKDPKLWVTLGFWLRVFDGEPIKCVIVTRKAHRLWLSQTLKRTIYDFIFLKTAEAVAYEALVTELQLLGCPYVTVEYDKAVTNPRTQIDLLNEFLDIDLSMPQWSAVFDESNLKKPSLLSWVKAILIYVKNYKSRIRPPQSQVGCE